MGRRAAYYWTDDSGKRILKFDPQLADAKHRVHFPEPMISVEQAPSILEGLQEILRLALSPDPR